MLAHVLESNSLTMQQHGTLPSAIKLSVPPLLSGELLVALSGLTDYLISVGIVSIFN